MTPVVVYGFNSGIFYMLRSIKIGFAKAQGDGTSFSPADTRTPLDYGADTFATAHADYVQITTALPLETDSYWQALAESQSVVKPTHADCLTKFGANDADPLLPTRDFRVVQAFADKLLLEARDPVESPVDWALVTACFPTAQTYRLRAGNHWVLRHDAWGFRHDIVASGTDRQCVRSCDPLRKWSKGRVFEIASDPSNCRAAAEPGMPDPGDPLDLRVGCATDGDVCVYDQATPLKLSDPAAACIFNGLNDRFALYRGRLASVRDAAFTWNTTGGFTPLLMSVASLSSGRVVAPQSIQFLQQPEQMAIVDGASQGLSLFSLDTFSVVKPSPFY